MVSSVKTAPAGRPSSNACPATTALNLARSLPITTKSRWREILELADWIVVMHDGQVVHEMPAAGAEPQEIGRHMLGHH
jgi:hypothetical protein